MPTIHLSIPEWMYDELKRKAEDMGIQVTDLVKFYIKEGIEGETKSQQKDSTQVEESITFLEAKVAQLDALLGEVMKRLKEEDEEDEEVEIKES
ncbi:hypothetical protein CM19_03000 [Candidatus Acidianus copahuensis]|uniref:Uncharacterized protein n=1 Tax=Candidatus Acidianus copahuensis TaxID=1160895 RepID=A0A031LR06_9CREN|nr:hypothetical protein [Candidatus Acidianus copahuensis]EZQ10817.1 hypothetical protein CM19_03000 [Candidatus Acidianus copahuensis]